MIRELLNITYFVLRNVDQSHVTFPLINTRDFILGFRQISRYFVPRPYDVAGEGRAAEELMFTVMRQF